ncbi:MAG: hypothetical protein HUJ99_06515, partial [Bacteroidaceae bacterium]|nr:hypothetical protein [Bacteroidaceae bacterium]
MDVDVPADAPNLLILTRADHGNVAAGCLQLFLEWKKAGKNAELHMYGDGNGPFALASRRSATTTDTWTDNLFSWLEAKGFTPQTSNYIPVDDGGSGPYKAVIDRSPETPDFTLYHPANLAYAVQQEGPLPLIVFANGGCSFTSKHYEKFLTEIASHGYLVAAVGSFDEMTDEQIQRLGMTDTEYQIHAIDVMQALNDNPKSAFYHSVDMKQVCAMGQSCGGGQALTTAIADARVTNCVALNSGFVRHKPPFPVEEPGSKRPEGGPKEGFAKKVSEGGLFGKEFGGTMTQADLAKLHSPVLYLIGGPDDVAYPNANENYELVKVPVAVCNLPVGHMATYADTHGGAFAEIALKWLDWQMKGRNEENRFFLDPTYQKEKFPDWDVKQKNWK